MEKRDTADTVAAPSDLDVLILNTGPPPDTKELQPFVKIVDENQIGRMKASGTISPPATRKPAVSAYPPSDLDQELKSCGAPPPTTMLKPYIRVAESKGRLQARGTMCASKHKQDNDTLTRSAPPPIRKLKSVPVRRRWNKRNKPPEPPKTQFLRNRPGEGLTSASTEPPQPPKNRIGAAGGLTSAATEDLPLRQKRGKMLKSSSSQRSLIGREKRNKPSNKVASNSGFWARLKGSSREPTFEERLAKQLGTNRGFKSVGLVRENVSPSPPPTKQAMGPYARHSKEHKRLSMLINETLGRAEGVLKPSDVKRLQQTGTCS